MVLFYTIHKVTGDDLLSYLKGGKKGRWGINTNLKVCLTCSGCSVNFNSLEKLISQHM